MVRVLERGATLRLELFTSDLRASLEFYGRVLGFACAVGGTQGRWKQFSNATEEEWRIAADAIRSHGGVE